MTVSEAKHNLDQLIAGSRLTRQEHMLLQTSLAELVKGAEAHEQEVAENAAKVNPGE